MRVTVWEFALSACCWPRYDLRDALFGADI
jgi:hypothetical protein